MFPLDSRQFPRPSIDGEKELSRHLVVAAIYAIVWLAVAKSYERCPLATGEIVGYLMIRGRGCGLMSPGGIPRSIVGLTARCHA